ncbi:hypothetical protein TTHERM_000691669 (macronuclear) [Tetrahymena thermophila SB210]|uniref:Uncharacterized protein n=1 Tax=Tetrahymena thermophila (strain SB210) TaxID=312017 RepID=W7XGT5_TETTS|nr:hypothetical protein TTHERM_000691669 [Tetrahymena thermophila SB210]EWS72189.1 hypothetical protein TTHERM_000691669 [Tetrahymena thermophila SB210]|eukprot:XP_012655282.1 hypothetical protein TTHERM_000691669 [Tetrahymena thermophila SB210]
MINVLFSNEELRQNQEITQESYKQFVKLKYSRSYDISSKYKGYIIVEIGKVNPNAQHQQLYFCIQITNDAMKDPSARKITNLLLTLQLNIIKNSMLALIPINNYTVESINMSSLYQKMTLQLFIRFQLVTQIKKGTLANPIIHIHIVKIQLGLLLQNERIVLLY